MFMIAVGAIMRFAVSAQGKGFNVHTAGMVLMVVGIIGAILSVAFWASWASWGGVGRGGRRWRRRDGRAHGRPRAGNSLKPNWV